MGKTCAPKSTAKAVISLQRKWVRKDYYQSHQPDCRPFCL